MSEEGFYNTVPDGNFKPSAVLLWAVQTSAEHAAFLPILRAASEDNFCWIPPPIVLSFSGDSYVQIDGSGALSARDVRTSTFFGWGLSEQQLAQLSHDFVDELKVLLHFILISRSANIAVQDNQWPPAIGPDGTPLSAGSYRTLKCTGPTSFKWLPMSGMTQT